MEKTAQHITADDYDIQSQICDGLHELGGYHITMIPNMFILAVPEGDAIPVLLHTNIDTVRAEDEDPPTLAWRDITTDGRPDFGMYNTKGRLGSGRVGIGLMLASATWYKEKPFLLFTNHNYAAQLGMERLIQEKVLEPYLDYIYAAISCTRSGYNYFSTRYYENDGLSSVVQGCGMIQKGVKLDDVLLLEDVYGIRSINISCGIFNKDSFDEHLSDFGYYQVRENLMLLMPSIKEPYRCGVNEEVIEYVYKNLPLEGSVVVTPTTNTKCYICGKPERKTVFNEHAQAFICEKCANRAAARGVVLNQKKLDDEKRHLKNIQALTRKANAAQPVLKLKQMPVCPVCLRKTGVMWNPELNVFWCVDCDQHFFMGKHKGQRTHVYLRNERVITSVINKNKDRVIKNESLSPYSAIIQCDSCGTYSMSSVQIPDSNPARGWAGKITVCPECADSINKVQERSLNERIKYEPTQR